MIMNAPDDEAAPRHTTAISAIILPGELAGRRLDARRVGQAALPSMIRPLRFLSPGNVPD
jgi:hypothetical protein